jgi:hypothetical protein
MWVEGTSVGMLQLGVPVVATVAVVSALVLLLPSVFVH